MSVCRRWLVDSNNNVVNPAASRLHFGPEYKRTNTDSSNPGLDLYCDPQEFMPKMESDDDLLWRWPVVSAAYLEEVPAHVSHTLCQV
jgi:hypothetical protein